MTPSELRSRSAQELKSNLEELEESLFHLKFQHVLGQLEETSQLKRTRKDIARIQTILHARELGIESSP